MQTPRISHVPRYSESSGHEAIELAESAGLFLDPWQQRMLIDALGERPDGRWAAKEVGLVVSRQNGKNAILEARQLAGLFLLEEELQIHSAHLFATSMEAFRRLITLIDENSELKAMVPKNGIKRSHGEEGIELKNGQRILFRTRTKGGGRGLTADAVYLDEAYELAESFHGALMPTLSAVPNPQIWLTSSAVDQMVHDNGVVLARVRERGVNGGADAERLLYGEWSADENAVRAHPELADDPQVWAQANPALNVRIDAEHIAGTERPGMSDRTFLVERLGVGDWPTTSGVESVIPADWVVACQDLGSTLSSPPAFVYDVTPDQSAGALCVSGTREDDLAHVEVIDHRAGTSWMPTRIAEVLRKAGVDTIGADVKGPAGSQVLALEALGITVEPISAAEHAQACGMFFNAMKDGTVRHRGQPVLLSAMKGAGTRPLGDAWAWSRKSSDIDISPLVGCTLALWRSAGVKPALEPLVRRGR